MRNDWFCQVYHFCRHDTQKALLSDVLLTAKGFFKIRVLKSDRLSNASFLKINHLPENHSEDCGIYNVESP